MRTPQKEFRICKTSLNLSLAVLSFNIIFQSREKEKYEKQKYNNEKVRKGRGGN